MNKADVLKKREIHRGDPEGLALNFLLNYSAPARLMRSDLPPKKGKEDLLQAAMRAYVIGIAACTETFFRDVFVFLLRHNPGLFDRALKESVRSEPAGRLKKYLAQGVSADEFAAAASFQNASNIDHNISIFFAGRTFFAVLDQFELVCAVPSAGNRGPAKLKLPSSWRNDLDLVFSLRHEFAHDANSKTIIRIEDMRRIETSALLICQLTVLLPGIRPPIIVSEKQRPAILLIADLIAEDWEIADGDAAR